MRDEWTSSNFASIEDLFAEPLPKVASRELGPYNQIVQSHFLDGFRLRGNDVSFRLSPIGATIANKQFLITAEVETKTLCISCDIDAFTTLFPNVIDCEKCDVETLRFLLHLLVDGVGGPIAALCGDLTKLQICETIALPPSLTVQFDTIIAGQQQISLLMWGDLDLLTPFAKTVPTVRAQRLSRSIKYPCRLVSQTFVGVSGAGFKLEEGCLIYVEGASVDTLFDLHVGHRKAANGAFQDGNFVISSQRSTEAQTSITGGKSEMPEDQSVIATENIQTEMSVEIGAWTMKLDEVNALTLGAIVDVGQLATNTVIIRLNGEIVGSGSLLSMADGIAVRINELA